MITTYVYVTAGDIGSHHAAHAAMSAAARKRIAAAKTQRPWIGASPN